MHMFSFCNKCTKFGAERPTSHISNGRPLVMTAILVIIQDWHVLNNGVLNNVYNIVYNIALNSGGKKCLWWVFLMISFANIARNLGFWFIASFMLCTSSSLGLVCFYSFLTWPDITPTIILFIVHWPMYGMTWVTNRPGTKYSWFSLVILFLQNIF